MCVLCARTNSISFLSCSWTLDVKALWDLRMRLKYFTYEISCYNTHGHLKKSPVLEQYWKGKHLLKLRTGFLPHASDCYLQYIYMPIPLENRNPLKIFTTISLVRCWGINRTCAFFPRAKPQQYTVMGASRVILAVGQTESSSEAPWWESTTLIALKLGLEGAVSCLNLLC